VNWEAITGREISFSQMDLMYELAKSCKVVIELGAHHGGGSTRAIWEGIKVNPKAEVWISVDIRDSIFAENRPTIPLWHFVKGDDRKVGTLEEARVFLGGKKADLIFIDTVHTYEHMKDELALWVEVAAPDCVWAFHDTWMGGQYNHMTDAIREFAVRSGCWRYVDKETQDQGFGMLVPA